MEQCADYVKLYLDPYGRKYKNQSLGVTLRSVWSLIWKNTLVPRTKLVLYENIVAIKSKPRKLLFHRTLTPVPRVGAATLPVPSGCGNGQPITGGFLQVNPL